MEKIYKNEELLEFTKGSYLIHDASVTRFDIYMHELQLCIDVYFNPIFKSERQLKIHFTDIIEYQFSWSDIYNFFTVESYKFFSSDQGYYISLCPDLDNSLDEASDNDQDFILCKNIEGYLI